MKSKIKRKITFKPMKRFIVVKDIFDCFLKGISQAIYITKKVYEFIKGLSLLDLSKEEGGKIE